MSKFRSRLARYNTNCCEQVMPVPVIPVCAVSCCIPLPICEFKPPECNIQPPQPCNPPEDAINNAPNEALICASSVKTPEYRPDLPNPPTGSILTISSTIPPPGFLLADGSEISRTTFSSLFSVIGTYYGDGDSASTFSLPNISCDTLFNCVVSYIIKT